MTAYRKQLQLIVEEYREAGEPWPASAKAIAGWALRTKRWRLHESTVLNRCAEEIATAMREEYITDPKGRRVRRLHAATTYRNGVQQVLWDDIRTASRDHMVLAFNNRRKSIVGDCRQLKTDGDSYNDAHPEQEPIWQDFDFTMDLLEIEAANEAANDGKAA